VIERGYIRMRLIEHTPKKWKKFVKSRSPISESLVPLDSKGTRKNWSVMSDRWLLSYAQWFVDENNIKNKKRLENADSGLHSALYKRKDPDGVRLLDKIEFKSIRRDWRYYSDEELVDYAQNYVDENNIKNKKGLENADRGLHSALSKRKDPDGVRLLDKIEFKSIRRDWSKYSNDELVEYAQKNVDENNITTKSGLLNTDSRLYQALYRRKDPEGVRLLDRVFEPIEQNQRLQGLQEIADAMEEF
jgi:hypothetical protein